MDVTSVGGIFGIKYHQQIANKFRSCSVGRFLAAFSFHSLYMYFGLLVSPLSFFGRSLNKAFLSKDDASKKIGGVLVD
jgi:hypothetical protein